MSRFLKGLVPAVLGLLVVSPALAEGGFGLGRPATEAEIAAWDMDISPGGAGLPVGSGDVWTGDQLFQDYCAACHGVFAEGLGNWPELAGGEGTLDRDDPVKTVGSYWPYLSTVYDYVRRSMPYGSAQTLSDDDVYAIVAYILYSNDLVGDDFELSDENFRDIVLPNADGFIVDDRDTVEVPLFSGEPCMENCKDGVEITMRARVLDVTPEDEDTASEAPATEAVAVAADTPELDPALVAEGEKVFRKCKACHMVGEGAKNRVGPHLNDVIGRTAGTIDGFRYSDAMAEAGADGLVWTDEALAEFLENPKAFLARTKMVFAGFRDAADIEAVTAYLKSAGG